MPITVDIERVFRSYESSAFDPTDCRTRVDDLLIEASKAGAECDARNEATAQALCNAYGMAAGVFLRSGFPTAATSMLQEGWTRLSALQDEEGTRIYRAGMAIHLAHTYLGLDDRGAALRWALLTQAADLLGGHKDDGGVGRQLLRSTLGMTEAALDVMKKLAGASIGSIESEGWRSPRAYPEDLLTRMALSDSSDAPLFSLSSRESSYALEPSYFRALLERADEQTFVTTAKGSRLEDVAAYLCLLIPGLTPQRNVLDEEGAGEADLVVRNLATERSVVVDLLGRHFLVECKNWSKVVGTEQVGYFLYRMRLARARFGIIFSSEGVTGRENPPKEARALIRRAFDRDESVCIVVDRDDLKQLGSRYPTFWALVLEKVERGRFGATHWSP